MSEFNALVTGASRGIGAAVAREFAAAGGNLVLAARTEDSLTAVAAEITDGGGTAIPVAVDVREEAAVRSLVDATAEALGTIDVLVACAGIYSGESGHTPLPEERYESFDDHMSTNARGVFATIREAAPHLTPEARVLVPSGIPARQATPGTGAYAVSKAAAEAVARGFAADLEQVVGVVDPGQVITELSGKETGREPDEVAPLFVWAALEAPAETVDGEVVGLREWRQATR